MSVKIGFVKFKNEKEFRGNTLYSIKLDGDDELYRMGDEKSVDGLFVSGGWDDFEEGDAVGLKVRQDRKGNTIVDKIKILAEGDANYPDQPKPAPRQRRSGGGSRPAAPKGAVDWDAKDARITMLSVQDRARELVKLLLEQEAVKLPAKTKTEERREVILGLIDVEAARLYRQAYDVDGFLASAGEHTEKPVTVPADDDFGDDVAAAEEDF